MIYIKRKIMNKVGLLFNMYIYFDDSKFIYFVVFVGFFLLYIGIGKKFKYVFK